MANLATTTYKVTGTREAVNNLGTTFQDMEVDSKDIRLFKLAEHYGIDYEKKQISVRGHIYWEEYEEEEENDYYLLSFDTETAWDACNELFFEINRILGDELSISYRCCESGCDLFPTVKLEVQLRHRLPPSLERSGKGGGRRSQPGNGSTGNTK